MAAPDPEGVLIQPTRARVFSHLGRLRGPARSERIAADLGLHPNSVRVHLRRLMEAGLVRRETVPGRAGRPHFEWSVAPGGRPGGRSPAAYEELALWLVRALGGSRAAAARAERLGREIGRDAVPPPMRVGRPQHVLAAIWSSMGFQPEAERSGDRVTFVMRNCPYRAVAAQDPDCVCGLHRGMTRGLIDAVAAGARLAEFTPQEPRRAGCRVVVDGLAEPAAAGSHR